MKTRGMALLLALLLLLPLPVLANGDTPAASVAPSASAAPSTSAGDPAQTAETVEYADVEALFAACTDHQLSSRMALAEALHDVVLSQMDVSIKQDALAAAQAALAQAEEAQLMALAAPEDVTAAQEAVDEAQTALQTAQLEQLKHISSVRAMTGVDISSSTYNARDFFFTLQPGEIALSFLQDSIVAYGLMEDKQKAVQEIEQDYIDIALQYAALQEAAKAYGEAQEAREEVALSLIMGNASDADFAAATGDMRQSRLELFTAMADYSRLLYRVNETCGGALSDEAGLLAEYLGTNS